MAEIAYDALMQDVHTSLIEDGVDVALGVSLGLYATRDRVRAHYSFSEGRDPITDVKEALLTVFGREIAATDIDAAYQDWAETTEHVVPVCEADGERVYQDTVEHLETMGYTDATNMLRELANGPHIDDPYPYVSGSFLDRVRDGLSL